MHACTASLSHIEGGVLCITYQYEDGATRSKIVAGWHPSWMGVRRRERKKQRETPQYSEVPSIRGSMQHRGASDCSP